MREAEAQAGGELSDHFITHSTPDGVSMTHRREHLRVAPPMAILAQQPRLVTDSSSSMPGSVATSSPARQVCHINVEYIVLVAMIALLICCVLGCRAHV